MPSVHLLRSQQNAVLHAIQEAGLGVADFEWEEVRRSVGSGASARQETYPKLGYKGSQFFFAFDNPTVGTAGHGARFSPGAEHLAEIRNSSDWSYQLHQFALWLGYLKREISAPDLWGAVAQGSALLRGEADQSDSENTPLTTSEQERIASALRELREYAATTYQLTSEQNADLRARVEYLIAASGRLGRKDWVTTW
jgi:hypothetical protein